MKPPPTLRKRAEFLALRAGARWSSGCFTLEWRKREAGETPAPGARFGFTVTKKTGNAVVRNRIRRRLREAVRLAAPLHAEPGCDYVLVGRVAALAAPFADIVADLARGLDRARRINANPREAADRRSGARRLTDEAGRTGGNTAGGDDSAAPPRA